MGLQSAVAAFAGHSAANGTLARLQTDDGLRPPIARALWPSPGKRAFDQIWLLTCAR